MTTDADRIALLTEHNDKMLEQVDKRQAVIDAQAAQLIAARAQVAELSVTVEQLQAQLQERNADVARKDAQIAELQEWRDEAVSVAHARWLPPTDARSPIEIAPSVKVELHDYLMAQAPSGEGYSEFIKRALNLRRMLD